MSQATNWIRTVANCFIIMSITTPAEFVERYGNDKDHFDHVLEHLFKPAVEKAGLTPIPPSATGSDLIQAEIIKRLELDDLVLCDMSTLNPNVFFELGIRTALDKPTCLVRDALTTKVPFDTSMINYHTYDQSLAPWKLDNEINSLADHLLKSINTSEGRNSLWRYFGLTKRAEMGVPDSPIEGKLDLILARLEEIEEDKLRATPRTTTEPPSNDRAALAQWIIDQCQAIAEEMAASFSDAQFTDDTIDLNLGRFGLAPDDFEAIAQLGKQHGFTINIKHN